MIQSEHFHINQEMNQITAQWRPNSQSLKGSFRRPLQNRDQAVSVSKEGIQTPSITNTNVVQAQKQLSEARPIYNKADSRDYTFRKSSDIQARESWKGYMDVLRDKDSTELMQSTQHG